MLRYSVINEKNKREILLLRGNGCKWRRCKFCDYHLDYSTDENENYEINKKEIDKVTGIYKKLEVINSGSFVDLDEMTMKLLKKTVKEKGINEIHFESHYMHRNSIAALKEEFKKIGVAVKVKLGVETFDMSFRESIFDKGIDENQPENIARYFDEVCLLFGITGQTARSMLNDIETGLKYFERVCINIMEENTTQIKPNKTIIQDFITQIYPLYKDNFRVDILFNNTDFGVGGQENE